ncbi:MAG: DUF5678 domain-containing protein, partial [Thermoguttaceae bacterium]
SVAFRAQRNATECVPYRIRPGNLYPGLNQAQTFRARVRADAAAMGGRKDLKRYGGQWVAFSADGCRIVASGENIAQVSERVNAAQEDLQEVVLERIEIETDDIHLGGAELL